VCHKSYSSKWARVLLARTFSIMQEEMNVFEIGLCFLKLYFEPLLNNGLMNIWARALNSFKAGIDKDGKEAEPNLNWGAMQI